ncbi:hypothetical protein GCM10025857_32450 [Alicyclobacillus contaminans]|uniref:biotin/lipoyl-containing protein n=1 Tax=Alicyclobacillus contaminans TaxID=392016 RepID=UPI00040F6BD1|nr:biotin/lipoyl-containing protein [Alicyclobacillus contaminans]GMA51888.1 hypothetical protein GCM10025857_32450 [Alicyclobacillus contaminans]
MADILVPDLGETTRQATVGAWLKRTGDRVQAGEPVVELETEKVNLEVVAESDGVLGTIHRQTGDTVTVGDILATLDLADSRQS